MSRQGANATVFWYALPGVGVSFAYTLILIMFMKYSTDVLHVNSAVIGLILFFSKAWDAVSDPAAGYLSDRTRSLRGRRKSWLLASSLPLALFCAMLWIPPAGLEGGALIAWISVGVFGFYTAYTIFEVPHLALGAELSSDFRERNRLFGGRQLGKMLGLILAGTLGVTLLDSPNARANAVPLVLLVGAFTAISLWVSVRALPPERDDYIGRGGENPLRSIGDVWRNRLARTLLIVFFIESLGMGGIGVLVPYVIEYVLEMPGKAAYFLAAYTGSTILSIPLWVRLGGSYEKRRLWMVAMGMTLFGFGMLIFVTPGAWLLMAVSSVIAGAGGGCGPTIGASLKADVIDVDEHRTGERKEGAYFAAWNLMSKLGAGVMLGVVGVVLDAVDFRPGEVQTETVRRAMLFLMGGMPIIGYSIGMWLFARFDLDKAEHARILEEIRARAANSGGTS